MMPVRAWRIFYADGSTFTSNDGTWAEAPPFGLSCVVYYHTPPYKTVDSGGDGGLMVWRGEDVHPDYQGIKMGLWVDRDGFYRVQDLASRSTMPEVT